MSGYIPGLASPNISLYEPETPVITGTVLENLNTDVLPVNGTVQYTLVNASLNPNPATPLTDYLVEATVEFTVTGPPGEIEDSTISMVLSGSLTGPFNFTRDVVGSGYTGYVGNSTEYTAVFGLLRILYNQPIYISIERIGGNPAVTLTINQVFKKIKKLN